MTQQRSEYPLDYSTHAQQSTAERAREMAENAGDRMKEMATDAQEMAGRAAEQAREYGEKAQQAARNFKPFVEKSMKEQPMATLAAAAVIGLVLGALWKR
jgi:ElaB/YqjD/DUF883 family membrane-anchored ribosome-binding protein